MNNRDRHLWAGKRVSVTGGEGFLGRRLVAALREAGAEVRVVRRTEHDLRTPDGARRAVDGAEFVFHLAAVVGGIGYNLRHAGLLIHDNLLLGAHMFEQSRLSGVSGLVAVSSVCSYPDRAAVPFREQDVWEGYPEPSNAPYGIAKRALLTLSDAYWNQYGFASCTPIVTNLYGPGDHDDLEDAHVIPALIRKFLRARERPGDPIEIWGSGVATRDFLYVDDAARALILAGERVEQPPAHRERHRELDRRTGGADRGADRVQRRNRLESSAAGRTGSAPARPHPSPRAAGLRAPGDAGGGPAPHRGRVRDGQPLRAAGR